VLLETERLIFKQVIIFEDGMADTVVAAVAADNPASIKVLEKCGFELTVIVKGLGMDP
jgi:RimJ/RimL family protein N-acetyltransferase